MKVYFLHYHFKYRTIFYFLTGFYCIFLAKAHEFSKNCYPNSHKAAKKPKSNLTPTLFKLAISVAEKR
jgi:hypothetical protein